MVNVTDNAFNKIRDLIFEEKDYITEMMYVEVPEGKEAGHVVNEFANLLNINQDKIKMSPPTGVIGPKKESEKGLNSLSEIA